MKWHRRVIDMPAARGPNVKLALRELGLSPEQMTDQATAQKLIGDAIARKGHPSGEVLVPGVMSWDVFLSRLMTFDPIRAAVGLFSCFWEGAEQFLYPREYLLLSAERARRLSLHRRGKALGIDPAEGGDNTAFAVVDRAGLIELESLKTTNTTIVVKRALELARRHDVPATRIVFDRGGGGKQHADVMRDQGWNVRTVGFGESISLDPKRGLTKIETRMEAKEDKYVYLHRREEMYWELSELLDPMAHPEDQFAIPVQFLMQCVKGADGIYRPMEGAKEQRHHLMHQMTKIPKLYDKEGRAFLPSKTRNPGEDAEGKKIKTLVERVGHSPDELEAVVLALHGLLHEKRPVQAGVTR